jgi:hypothetical protein
MDRNTPDASFSTLLLVQSRIFEAIASSTMLTGALHDLARQFDVAPDDFLDCLDGLVRAGWVVVRTTPESRVSIRLTY